MADFCKTLQLPDGTQVLVYFEPDGDTQRLHQVFDFGGMQMDAKVEGFCISEHRQQSWLDSLTPEGVLEQKEKIRIALGI